VDNDTCRNWYKSKGKKTKILDSQMCAGYEQGGRDSCWVSNAHQNGAECAVTYIKVFYVALISYAFSFPWLNFMYRPSYLLDVDNAFGCLHRVDVGRITNISDIHTASIFRIRVSRVTLTQLIRP
jgi:hypothetical protein